MIGDEPTVKRRLELERLPQSRQGLGIGERNAAREFGSGISRTHKRRIDQMLDQKPGLQLIGSDHVRDDDIICSVIS